MGVTAQQRVMVRFVGLAPGISPGHLAELLHLDPGTVSTTVRRLEAKGLLLRRRDAIDARRTTLFLSARGRRLDRPTDGTVESAVAALLTERSSEDMTTTSRVLDDLTELLDRESAARDRSHSRGGRRSAPLSSKSTERPRPRARRSSK